MKQLFIILSLLLSITTNAQNTYDFVYNAYLNNSDSALSVFLNYWYQNNQPISSLEFQNLSFVEKEAYYVCYEIYEGSVLDSVNVSWDFSTKEFFIVSDEIIITQVKSFFDDNYLDRIRLQSIIFRPNFTAINSKPLPKTELYSEIFIRFYNQKYFANDSLAVLNMLPRRELSNRKKFINKHLIFDDFSQISSISFDEHFEHAVLWISVSEYCTLEIML